MKRLILISALLLVASNGWAETTKLRCNIENRSSVLDIKIYTKSKKMHIGTTGFHELTGVKIVKDLPLHITDRFYIAKASYTKNIGIWNKKNKKNDAKVEYRFEIDRYESTINVTLRQTGVDYETQYNSTGIYGPCKKANEEPQF